MRIMVYGDSNSWGFPPDGSGLRMGPHIRWPRVMAGKLGCEVVEECLPGRTTVHDDPELLGPAMNGLAHLPVALKSHCPLDMVLIMLGTNDLKARFAPTAESLAGNLERLVECIRTTGAGGGPWATAAPAAVALIVPPPLGPRADDPGWERFAEWRGGRAVSRRLAGAVAAMGRRCGVPVLDAGKLVAPSRADPIHLAPESHPVLGEAVADWLARQMRIRRVPR